MKEYYSEPLTFIGGVVVPASGTVFNSQYWWLKKTKENLKKLVSWFLRWIFIILCWFVGSTWIILCRFFEWTEEMFGKAKTKLKSAVRRLKRQDVQSSSPKEPKKGKQRKRQRSFKKPIPWRYYAILSAIFTVVLVGFGKLFFKVFYSPTSPSKESAPKPTEFPWFGWGGVVVVLTILVVIAIVLWYRRRSDDKPKSENARKITVGVVGFFIFHLLFRAFWMETWQNWFADGEFFLATNLALVAIILFPALFGKPETQRSVDMGKSWGMVFAVMLAIVIVGRLVNGRGNEVGSEQVLESIWETVDGPDKDSVMSAFPDDTVMWNIAAVESGFRQFKDSTRQSPLQNQEGSSAFGVFQIMESAHGRDCGIPGIDIYTLEGNIACAQKLRENNPDYSDWFASADKWRGPIKQTETTIASTFSPQDSEGEEFVVTIPSGGSEVVEVPFGYKLSQFTAETSDSFTFISPSGKVYRMESGKKNPPVGYEVGSWKFAIDSTIADLRIHVTRVPLRD